MHVVSPHAWEGGALEQNLQEYLRVESPNSPVKRDEFKTMSIIVEGLTSQTVFQESSKIL
jgi:hypothetical protein